MPSSSSPRCLFALLGPCVALFFAGCGESVLRRGEGEGSSASSTSTGEGGLSDEGGRRSVDPAGSDPNQPPPLLPDDESVSPDGGYQQALDGAGTASDGGAAASDAGAPASDAETPSPLHPDASPKPDRTNGTAPGTCGNVFETQVLELTNQERAKQGKAPLACHLSTGSVARAFSLQMCQESFFSHVSPQGSTMSSRLKAGGIAFKSAGENIAAGYSTPAAVVKGWMNSSGHRANILGDFKYLGVGYAPCAGPGKHGTYWTQDFWR